MANFFVAPRVDRRRRQRNQLAPERSTQSIRSRPGVAAFACTRATRLSVRQPRFGLEANLASHLESCQAAPWNVCSVARQDDGVDIVLKHLDGGSRRGCDRYTVNCSHSNQPNTSTAIPRHQNSLLSAGHCRRFGHRSVLPDQYLNGMPRMNIEEFYDQNPKRRASVEFEFGNDWLDGHGQRGEVSWVHDTGELYLMIAPIEPLGSDAVGDLVLNPLPTSQVTVTVLKTISSLRAAERLLDGWFDAMNQPNCLAWLRERLAHPPDLTTDDPTFVEVDEPHQLGGPLPGAGRATTSNSAVIALLVKRLHDAMPHEERAQLVTYRDRGRQAGADSHAEWHRAYECARWAYRIVSLGEHKHLAIEATRAVEAVREIEEFVATETVGFGFLAPRRTAELAWVEEAARVAVRGARRSGWSTIPWEALLEKMLQIAPVNHGDSLEQ
jgi:hypothetical protein